MKTYFGTFNENGYEIDYVGNEQDVVYRAGNCKFDSQQGLPVGAEGTLDIANIDEFCESTGKEIAAENGGNWAGCQRVENYEIPD